MTALSSLFHEHRLILRLADALEVYASHLVANPDVRAEDLGHFANVFRHLVDYLHHEKEESILLPLAVEQGLDWTLGAAPEIRREHRQERYLIDVLYQASQRDGAWSAEERRHISATAQAIVEFERTHLAKENRDFFPRVLALPAEALKELRERLERFDAEHDEASGLRVIAQSLVARYAPEPAALGGAAANGGSHA